MFNNMLNGDSGCPGSIGHIVKAAKRELKLAPFFKLQSPIHKTGSLEQVFATGINATNAICAKLLPESHLTLSKATNVHFFHKYLCGF